MDEMTESERADLAERIATARRERFKGNRLAAYSTAGINSATWARLESGERAAERSVIAVLQMLWPETGGDWRKLDPPLGYTPCDFENQVRTSNLPQEVKDYILTHHAPEPTPPAKDESA